MPDRLISIAVAESTPLVALSLPGQLPAGGKYSTRFDPILKMHTPKRRKNPKTGKYAIPTAFEIWLRRLNTLLLLNRIPPPPRSPWLCPVALEVDYWPSDKRARDAPAMLDALGNFLELRKKKVGRKIYRLPGTGWVRDDSQLLPVWRERELDRKDPRCEVRLWRV